VAGALTAIDLSASQGAAVLGLLERAKVPPQPAFYKLLYDYVSGVEGLFSTRVRDILAEGERGSSAVGERLYAEFVEPYETRETIDRAVARITARLQTLDVLLTESARVSAVQSASLAQATTHFEANKLNPVLLRDWVTRLESTNEDMRKAQTALSTELKAAQTELDETRVEIENSRESVFQDPLTGLANRGGLDRALTAAMRDQRTSGTPLACAVVDIDHFKSLNDRYGHPVGDEVLRIVSRALLVSARTGDLVGRPGGDEFLIVLPATDLPTANLIADRMRSAVADADLAAVLGAGTLGGITVSVGVALLRGGDSIASFVERADHSLYEAKRQGRNRVVADLDRAA
jgi:diguanylate cyclase